MNSINTLDELATERKTPEELQRQDGGDASTAYLKWMEIASTKRCVGVIGTLYGKDRS